jgi:hypothetical protein
MHIVCSNVCRQKYHGENTHGGHSITTKLGEGVAMQRDWEEHISGSVEQETCVDELAGVSRNEALKVRTMRGSRTSGWSLPCVMSDCQRCVD